LHSGVTVCHAANLVADLAETTLNDGGYIHFDERQSSQIGTIIPASIGVVPVDKVLPVKERMEQLEAKVTCMCGDYVDHHGYHSGHSPVSMYDYSLSRAPRKRTSSSRPGSLNWKIDSRRCSREQATRLERSRESCVRIAATKARPHPGVDDER
jgi:hypothetical protein